MAASSKRIKGRKKTRSKVVKHGSRAGLAAFAFGVSLAVPHSLGVAWADSDGSDSPSRSPNPGVDRVVGSAPGKPSVGPRRQPIPETHGGPAVPEPAQTMNRIVGPHAKTAASELTAPLGSRPALPTAALRATTAVAGNAGRPVGQPVQPLPLHKALFNATGKPTSTARIYWVQSSPKDAYISVNYPTHALWSSAGKRFLGWGTQREVFPEWMLSDSREIGGPMYPNPNTADRWTLAALEEVRSRLNDPSLGVFSPAFPFRIPMGYKFDRNGDGISVTRYFGDPANLTYGQNAPTPFGSTTYGDRNVIATQDSDGLRAFRSFLDVLSTIPIRDGGGCPTGPSGSRCNQILTGSGDDIVMPGWLGNAEIATGAGNDIILASPQLHIAVADRSQTASWSSDTPLHNGTHVYYPTPYVQWRPDLPDADQTGLNANGNVFRGESGDDLIYFDGGVAQVFGGSGNDVLAPSFGSFNWSLDTLIQGTHTWEASQRWLGQTVTGFGPPLRLYKAPGNTASNLVWGTAYVSGYQALLSPDPTLNTEAAKVPTYLLRKLTQPVNSGLLRDPKTGEVQIDPKTINKLGGQELYGGDGDDLIYGIDPDFYKGFQTAAQGQGLRVLTNWGQDAKPGRAVVQQFHPVKMFGGRGSDYFAIGNLRNLENTELYGGVNYFYKISGNSDDFGRKDSPDFGTNFEGDIFEFNLTYEGENWTTSATGAPGTSASADKIVKAGFDGLKTVNDIGKNFTTLSFLAFPKFAAVASLGSYVAGLFGAFTPKPPTPITSDSSYYRDPLGEWRNTVEIQDWDPADSIVIHVDPASPSANSTQRWTNVVFGLNGTKDQPPAGSSNALDIVYKTPGQADRTLVRLDQFFPSNSSGGWYAYDFYNNTEVAIESRHLAFFGQVSFNPDDQDLLKALAAYEDEYNFPVAQGAPLFRWTDSSLGNDSEWRGPEGTKLASRLATLQENSERIVLQLDTMELGYYWDTRYKGTASESGNALEVDAEKTTLWIRSQVANTPTWTAVATLAQLNNPDPTFDSLRTDYGAKAVPYWKGVQPGV